MTRTFPLEACWLKQISQHCRVACWRGQRSVLWQHIGTWQYIGHDCLTGSYRYYPSLPSHPIVGGRKTGWAICWSWLSHLFFGVCDSLLGLQHDMRGWKHFCQRLFFLCFFLSSAIKKNPERSWDWPKNWFATGMVGLLWEDSYIHSQLGSASMYFASLSDEMAKSALAVETRWQSVFPENMLAMTWWIIFIGQHKISGLVLFLPLFMFCFFFVFFCHCFCLSSPACRSGIAFEYWKTRTELLRKHEAPSTVLSTHLGECCSHMDFGVWWPKSIRSKQ